VSRRTVADLWALDFRLRPTPRPDLVRLPHPIILLLGAIGIAAALTWVLPAGEYERRDDPATGRRVAVPGTYHRVEAAPVRPFRAVMAVPRGFAAGIDVVMTILIVGAGWVVIDRLGTLRVLVGAIVRRFTGRGLMAIPVVSLFFAMGGALENMQEEIIPLIPVLLLLGRGVGVDALTVVAMSAGAAMIGSAFGPTNPFQAGIALKLAELPPLAGGGIRLLMLVIGFAIWVAWTMRHAVRNPQPVEAVAGDHRELTRRDVVIVGCLLLPLAMYVYGVMRLSWGFDELSAAFLVGAHAGGVDGELEAHGHAGGRGFIRVVGGLRRRAASGTGDARAFHGGFLRASGGIRCPGSGRDGAGTNQRGGRGGRSPLIGRNEVVLPDTPRRGRFGRA